MRLVTRGDLDGLACAVILRHHEEIHELFLAHPQDISDRRLEVGPDDVIANLPYDPRCGLWFDHHLVPVERRPPAGFAGRHRLAESAAQVIWEHYGSDPRFARLVAETNRLDSARLTEEDVDDPNGLVLLGFTLDGRTGLGPVDHYFRRCVDWVSELPIERVLEQPLVTRRIERMRAEDEAFREALETCSVLRGPVVVTDFRRYLFPPVGNRFLVYRLFPAAEVSVRVHWGPKRRFAVAAVGRSVFRRTSTVNVGELMARFGGGGHAGAGSAPLSLETADADLEEIVRSLGGS